jgi:tripartite-type tricarboxylate transporter receptor subunit TctC
VKAHHPIKACCLAVALALTLGSVAQAQNYPTRTVKIVVPYAPSGASDFLARLLTPKLSDMWGVPVIVDNRPGASGNIGMELVAKSPPDGYTLGMASGGVAMTVSLFPKLSFNIAADFEPLGLIGSTPMVLTVNPSLPVKTLAEFTAYAGKNPGRLSYGSCGIGSPQQLAVELYRSMARVDMVHVPYRGCAPAVTDVLAGQVQVLVATVASVEAHIRSGMLRALAITSKQGSTSFPDVPTFDQAGLTGYDLDVWFGLMAPAKTPAAVLSKIHQDVLKVVRMPEIVERMKAGGVELRITTPDGHAALLKEEVAKYSNVVSGLKMESAN